MMAEFREADLINVVPMAGALDGSVGWGVGWWPQGYRPVVVGDLDMAWEAARTEHGVWWTFMRYDPPTWHVEVVVNDNAIYCGDNRDPDVAWRIALGLLLAPREVSP